MRRSLLVLAGVAVAGVVTAGVVAAQATPAHHPDGRSFTVVEHAVTDTTTDTGAPGDSVGDLLTFANPVFDAANHRQVGTDNGSCIRTVAGSCVRVLVDDDAGRRFARGRGAVLRRP